MSRARFALLALLGCATPARDAPANHTPSSDSDALELEYRTWGLMPAPTCGSPTYAIAIARDRAVSCGWLSTCPPYSEAMPLRPSPKGRLTTAQASQLVELANRAEFLALPPFASNPHIIDGGEEQLRVRVAGRDKTVELANTSAPAFDALRDAVELATGCSVSTAGPRP